jgi:multiple sugar transport system substrate-binding protein
MNGVMETITFSIGNHGPVGMSNLRLLLQKFEQQYEVRVRLDEIPLSVLRWPKLVEAALYHSGPDVSEAGSSWIGDLVRMDALRPFTDQEIKDVETGRHFVNGAWQSARMEEQGISTYYSIPFTADVRVIFYRKDLLEKAGLDETKAFTDLGQLETTLQRLQASGISFPLTLPTLRTSVSLHSIASWIWDAGGDFLDQDGTGLAFDKPDALTGCKAYYSLARYLNPEAQNIKEDESDLMFCMGKAAVLISGFWVLARDLAPDVRKNLGVVPMPGVPFLGGGDLVIWNHSRNVSAALKLIRFLHTKEAVMLLHPWFGLPVCEDDWSNPPFNSQILQVFRQAIQKGRGFPTSRLWGLVEKRLTDTVGDIWIDVLNGPSGPLDQIIETHLHDLADRLQLSMGS